MGKSKCVYCATWSYPCLRCLISKERYEDLLRDLDAGKSPKTPAEHQYLRSNIYLPYPQPQSKGSQPQSQSTQNRPDRPAMDTRGVKRAHEDHDHERTGLAKKARREQEDYTRIVHGSPSFDIKSYWKERSNKTFPMSEVPPPVALPKRSAFQPPVSRSQRPNTLTTAPSPFPRPEPQLQRPHELPTKPRTPVPPQQSTANTEQSLVLAQQQPSPKTDQSMVRLPPRFESTTASRPETPLISQNVPQQSSTRHSSTDSSAQAARPNNNQPSQINVTRTVNGRKQVSRISITGSPSITVNVPSGSVTVTTPSESVSVTIASDPTPVTTAPTSMDLSMDVDCSSEDGQVPNHGNDTTPSSFNISELLRAMVRNVTHQPL